LATRGESLALAAGSAVHLGLAHWLETDDIEASVRIMADDYEAAVARYLKRIEQRDLPADDRRFAPEWVEAILHQYLTRYAGKWPFKVVKRTTEKPISARFPMAGREVLYVARLDGIVRRWESGGKWSLDWKTTRKASDWWIAKQQTSSQFTGQDWIARQQEDFDFQGVVLAVLEIPEPHRSEQTCKEHKVSYQECSIRHAGSHFVYVTRSDPERAAWKWTAKQLIRKYERLVLRAQEDGMAAIVDIPMEGRFNDSCTFCDMKDFCKLGRNVSRANLRATFIDEPWNPLREA
jgi:hypothetical protein